MHAEIGAVLGGRAAGLHLDLGHRVGDRPHARRRQQVGGGIDAVERQAVLDLALPGAAEAEADVAVQAAEDARRRARGLQTLRPLSGSSTIALADGFRHRRPIRVEHLRTRLDDVTDSLMPPTCIIALVRTTWLLATSTPVA